MTATQTRHARAKSLTNMVIGWKSASACDLRQASIQEIESILTEIRLVVSDDPGNPEATRGDRIPIGDLQVLGGLSISLRCLDFGMQTQVEAPCEDVDRPDLTTLSK
jgi:hypothetical protein